MRWTIVLMLLCLSCGGGDKDEGGGGEAGGETAIEVENNSAFTIDVVQYSTCGAAVFGDDVLAGAVGPQQTFTFEVPEGGCYDVLVELVDTDGVFVDQVRHTGLEVEDGETYVLEIANPE